MIVVDENDPVGGAYKYEPIIQQQQQKLKHLYKSESKPKTINPKL